MSDDIERLLREVGQATQPAASEGQTGQQNLAKSQKKPSRSAGGEIAKSGGVGGRLAFALIMAAVLGGVAWVAGVFLPFTGAVSMGMGGALGAFLCGLVAGPPRWFSS